MSLTNQPARRSFLLVATLATLAAACNKPRLPEATEAISLASASMPLGMSGPAGGTVKKGASPEEADVAWADRGASLTVRSKSKQPLGCPAGDSSCSVVEKTASSVIYESKQPEHVWGVVHHHPLAFGSEKLDLECTALAHHVDDARRLLAACESLAFKLPGESKTELTSASLPAAPKPLALDARTFPVKLPSGKVNVTARLPKDWPVKDSLGFTVVQNPNPASLDGPSINFGPAPSVKTLADAEREVSSSNIAKIETVVDKRELGPGRFLVVAAGRSAPNLTTVRVYARGKKGTVLATCSGTTARRADLESICSSVTAE